MAGPASYSPEEINGWLTGVNSTMQDTVQQFSQMSNRYGVLADNTSGLSANASGETNQLNSKFSSDSDEAMNTFRQVGQQACDDQVHVDGNFSKLV